MDSKGAAVVRKAAELDKKKGPWLEFWQLIGEMVHQLKVDFSSSSSPGDMLSKDLFDATAPDAAQKSSAALIGLMWQTGSRSFQFQPPDDLPQTAKNKLYYEKANATLRAAFDDPKAGFATAYEEYMFDQVSLGTSGLATFPGTDSDLSFEAWGVDEMGIALGFGGRAEVIYRTVCWPLRRVIRTYGIESLSFELREKVKTGDEKALDEEVTIIHAIEPRELSQAGKLSNLAMPYASYHVEKKTKHVIKESGFEELPIEIQMFYKVRKQDYGWSPAGKALPDILELNATKEMRLLAREKAYDPPQAVYSDSVMGNQSIDFSASAINVIKVSGKLKGTQPIFPLFSGANLPESDKAIEELKGNINGHFMIDRLIDFNNTAEMTLGEVEFRAQLRGEALGSVFNRQILLLQGVIERSTAVLYRAGKLGVIENSIEHRLALQNGIDPLIIPEDVANLIMSGKEFYKIEFFSPAARLMAAAETKGIMSTTRYIAETAQVFPELVDNVQPDEFLRIVAKNSGAPSIVMLALEEVKAIREQRLKMMEQRAQLEQANAETQIAAQASNIKPAA